MMNDDDDDDDDADDNSYKNSLVWPIIRTLCASATPQEMDSKSTTRNKECETRYKILREKAHVFTTS